MKSFKNFLLYNNTIPIAFGVLFLGAGATFAASPEARESVIGSEAVITEVDNSYLLNSTIDDSTVTITIGSVTEDIDSYYIEYQMETLGARDGVWQKVIQTKTLLVSKESVVGRDLGLYAEEEISEVHAAEVRLLKETQANERRGGITPKVVTTEYDGLIGQFFDPDQEVFPQYNPMIDPSVGVPLTRDQEKAHEAVKRLIEESKKKESEQRQPATSENTDPADSDNGDATDINPPPYEDPSPEPQPEPQPEPPPSPEPQPEPEPPLITEPIEEPTQEPSPI